jgi:hypothetical protein
LTNDPAARINFSGGSIEPRHPGYPFRIRLGLPPDVIAIWRRSLMIKLTTAPLLAALFVLPALATPAGAADPAGSPAANGAKPNSSPAAKPAANDMKPDDGVRKPTSKPDDGMRTDSPKTR